MVVLNGTEVRFTHQVADERGEDILNERGYNRSESAGRRRCVGGAFGTVVTSLVKDVFTPLIGNLVDKPDFSAIQYNHVMLGNFFNAVIAFCWLQPLFTFLSWHQPTR